MIDLEYFRSLGVEVKEIGKQGEIFFPICPFHLERSQGAFYNKEKRVFHCFSCGKTGTVITLLLQLGVSWDEIDNLVIWPKPDENELLQQLRDLKNPQEKKEKFISEDYMDRFQFRHLASWVEKFGKKTMNAFEVHWDEFEQRVVVPVRNSRGNIVQICGRSDTNSLKFRSYECERKGILGLWPSIYKDEINLVEGFRDVFRVWSLGYPVGALLGDELTEANWRDLKRSIKRVILCLDNDRGGVKATINIGERLFKENFFEVYVSLPYSKNPRWQKDWADDGISDEEVKICLERKIPFLEFKMKLLRGD